MAKRRIPASGPAPERGLDQLLAEAGELIVGGRLVKAPPLPEEPAAPAPAEPDDQEEEGDS